MKRGLRNFIIRSALAFAALGMTLLCISACGTNKDTVMTVGGFEVPYSYYRCLYMSSRSDIETELLSSADAADGMREEEIDAEARARTEESLRFSYALLSLAKEYELELSKDEKSTVDGSVKEIVASYGTRENFDAELARLYMTEDFVRFGIELQLYEVKLRSYMTDEYTGILAVADSVIEADADENFYRISQILIRNDPGEDYAANAGRAQEALGRALAGEDYTALITEYGIDGGDGDYCFTKDQTYAEVEKAVKALKEGELYPEVVTSEIGYHVIKRVELTEDYMNDHFSEIRRAYYARRFGEARNARAESLEIEYSTLYESLTADILKNSAEITNR